MNFSIYINRRMDDMNINSMGIKIESSQTIGVLNIIKDFHDFDEAIQFCEKEYGYNGLAWDIVKEKRNFYELSEFLNEDNIYAEVITD
jgi:hypothetical protein